MQWRIVVQRVVVLTAPGVILLLLVTGLALLGAPCVRAGAMELLERFGSSSNSLAPAWDVSIRWASG